MREKTEKDTRPREGMRQGGNEMGTPESARLELLRRIYFSSPYIVTLKPLAAKTRPS